MTSISAEHFAIRHASGAEQGSGDDYFHLLHTGSGRGFTVSVSPFGFEVYRIVGMRRGQTLSQKLKHCLILAVIRSGKL